MIAVGRREFCNVGREELRIRARFPVPGLVPKEPESTAKQSKAHYCQNDGPNPPLRDFRWERVPQVAEFRLAYRAGGLANGEPSVLRDKPGGDCPTDWQENLSDTRRRTCARSR